MTVDREQTFEAPKLPCKSVCVYADRAEVKRLLITQLKVTCIVVEIHANHFYRKAPTKFS